MIRQGDEPAHTLDSMQGYSGPYRCVLCFARKDEAGPCQSCGMSSPEAADTVHQQDEECPVCSGIGKRMFHFPAGGRVKGSPPEWAGVVCPRCGYVSFGGRQ